MPKKDESAVERLTRESGLRMIAVQVVTERFLIQVPGEPGMVTIDAGRGDLFDALDAELAAAAPQMLAQTAGPWVRQGITLRKEGDFAASYLNARPALWVALHVKNPTGIAAMSTNIMVLREGVRNVLERGLGPTRLEMPDAADAQALEASLRQLLEFVAADARQALVRTLDLVESILQSAPPDVVMAFMHAIHRFAAMSGAGEQQEFCREQMLDFASQHGLWHEVLEAAAEDLADVGAEDLIGGQAGPIAPAVDRYTKVRGRIAAIGPDPGFIAALSNAFRHIANQRLRATAGGGAFGHILSYRISPILQQVGRDLVWMLRKVQRPDAALDIAETLRARALTDWMARTHPHIARPPREFLSAINPLTGSINAMEPVGLEAMAGIAAATASTILSYLVLGDRVAVWVMSPDGKILMDEIDDPAPLVAQLVERFPYLDDPDPSMLTPAGKADLDSRLDVLYQAVIPASIGNVIASASRLAILADGILDAVPFAALRTPAGKYLAEETELVFWPSLTALLQLETAGDVVHDAATTRPAMILARTEFPEPIIVDGGGDQETYTLPRLPGAGDEARRVQSLLGTADLLLDREASWDALSAARKGIRVLHIATHGILDFTNLERSFLALADGPLTAAKLYRFDPGIRAELVVLSACQTALGAAHLDSVIGLSNAFLVAGANTVVSSLWRLPDAATRVLMETFYTELRTSGAQTVPGALRAAQRALIDHADEKLRNPLCWAAFKTTGRTANPLRAGR